MAGKRRFDEDTVLEQAVQVFWREGWHGAALPQLLAATGLSRSSLYNAFADKAGLYERSLEHYMAVYGAARREALEAPDINEAFDRYTHAFIGQLADPLLPPGCLAAQSCFDLGGLDGAPREPARNALERPRAALVARVGRAKDDGQLRRDFDVQAFADLIVVLLRGAAAAHRATGEIRWAKNSFDFAAQILRGATLTAE